MVTYFIPLFILAFLVLLLGIFAFLARWRGGRHMRPIVQTLAKVPLFERLMQRAAKAQLERQNPELASAIKKMERAGATRDPQKAQAALSRLAPSERRAYFEAVEQQQEAMPTPANREQRRRLEKARKQTKRGR